MSFFPDTFVAQWRRPMTHPRRIAVNSVHHRRGAAVPPHCLGSVTIMTVRRFAAPRVRPRRRRSHRVGDRPWSRRRRGGGVAMPPGAAAQRAGRRRRRWPHLHARRRPRGAARGHRGAAPPACGDRRPRRQGRTGRKSGACRADRRPRGRAQAANRSRIRPLRPPRRLCLRAAGRARSARSSASFWRRGMPGLRRGYTAPARPRCSPPNGPRGRPSLACGPIRIMP